LQKGGGTKRESRNKPPYYDERNFFGQRQNKKSRPGRESEKGTLFGHRGTQGKVKGQYRETDETRLRGTPPLSGRRPRVANNLNSAGGEGCQKYCGRGGNGSLKMGPSGAVKET